MENNKKDKNRSPYDTTIKDLFGHLPQTLLQILLGRQAVALMPVEFASTQKRIPDLVFLMDDDSIFHLDLQTQSEKMNLRMLMYYVFIRQVYPSQELIQKVLYIGASRWRHPVGIEEKSLSFRYEVIDIRDIDCRHLMASPVLEENILAILCRMDNQMEMIREILYRISALSDKARADALAKLFILSRLRNLETVVKTEAEDMALTFNLMENEVFRPLLLKMERDIHLKGEQEGEQKGEAKMLTRQLQRRFGVVPEWASEKIAKADVSSLEEWGLRVLDASTLDGVFADRV